VTVTAAPSIPALATWGLALLALLLLLAGYSELSQPPARPVRT
jgi:hypothetical protein